MSNEYTPTKRTKTTQNFNAYYNIDMNAFISQFLKRSQDASKKMTTETTIGGMLVNSLTRYVIGGGLTPQASPESAITKWSDNQRQEFAKSAEAYYRLMTGSRNYDFYGRNNFKALQAIAFRSILTSGDVLVHRSYKPKAMGYAPYVQLLSGQWVRNPNGEADTKKITGGVVFDRFGATIGYCIAQTNNERQDSFTTKQVSKFNQRSGYEEYDLIMLQAKEANQIRGIPRIAPVTEDIINAETFKTAYITKAIVQALLTAVIEREKDAPSNVVSSIDTIKMMANAQGNDGPLTGDEDANISLGAGNIIALNDGEKMNIVESKTPIASYDGFMKTMLLHIGSEFGVPYEMLVQEYNKSFSASKATVSTAEKEFSVLRNEFASKFCVPTWEQIIDFGIRRGVINAPGYLEGDEIYRKACLACSWIAPSPVVIDPTKETQAFAEAVANNFVTKERVTRELFGCDFEETVERRSKEIEMENAMPKYNYLNQDNSSNEEENFDEDENTDEENNEEETSNDE